MKIHKLTYGLLFLLATLGLAAGTQQQDSGTAESEYQKQRADRAKRFPTAVYDETDSPDVKKNQARNEKNLRKNDYRLVARNPPSWQAERLVINEGGIEFPALPVSQSTLIVLGKVTGAEAHVSEDKKNVYSEFTVSVEQILKSSGILSLEAEITVDRIGGFVRYPNGHSVLYRIARMNMPLTGERYLLFLTSKNQQDIEILTAYELGAKGVTPLDDSEQFEPYRGLTETALLDKLREGLR
jgi:hypothetical protein